MVRLLMVIIRTVLAHTSPITLPDSILLVHIRVPLFHLRMGKAHKYPSARVQWNLRFHICVAPNFLPRSVSDMACTYHINHTSACTHCIYVIILNLKISRPIKKIYTHTTHAIHIQPVEKSVKHIALRQAYPSHHAVIWFNFGVKMQWKGYQN